MEGQEVPQRRPQLFTVRIWTDAEGDRLHRGSVTDVATGAFHNFRHWSDLTAFLTGRIEDPRPTSEETS